MMECPECKMYMQPMDGCCEFCGYDLVAHYKKLREEAKPKKVNTPKVKSESVKE